MPVTVSRGGGFAGGAETIAVRADGSWTRKGSGSPRSGSLTAEQRNRLWSLLGDPRLAGEAGTHQRQGCADTYEWTVAAGSTKVDYTECLAPVNRPPVAAAVAELVDTATR